jgi:hypothetical protein
MSEDKPLSRNGVAIRLTDERWQHIIEEHAELAELRNVIVATIAESEQVLLGTAGELLAVRTIEPGKVMVVVYREVDADDGFVITAFVTRRLKSLEQREQLWPPPT